MSDSGWLDWMPIAVHPRPSGPAVDWCNFRGIRFTDPFFQQTVDFALSHPARMIFRRESPVGFLETLARKSPGIPPTGFIFHLSRCGSTLVSRMLASLPNHIVLSEPPALDQVLALPPGDGTPRPDARAAWLRALVNAWARPRAGESRFFIKFDSWHILELPLILEAFPDVPWIFLYRDPVEVLVSHRRMPGTQMVPGVVDPRRLGLEIPTVTGATLDEYAARVLAQLCTAALGYAGRGKGRLVNYSQLPQAVSGVVARHFGLVFTPEEEAQMAEAARFDAKSPGFVYQPDSARKQEEATDEIRLRAETWLGGLYGRLESERKRLD